MRSSDFSRSHNTDLLKNLLVPNQAPLPGLGAPTLREHLGPPNHLSPSPALPKDPAREHTVIPAARMRPNSGGPVSIGGGSKPAPRHIEPPPTGQIWGQIPASGTLPTSPPSAAPPGEVLTQTCLAPPPSQPHSSLAKPQVGRVSPWVTQGRCQELSGP